MTAEKVHLEQYHKFGEGCKEKPSRRKVLDVHDLPQVESHIGPMALPVNPRLPAVGFHTVEAATAPYEVNNFAVMCYCDGGGQQISCLFGDHLVKSAVMTEVWERIGA